MDPENSNPDEKQTTTFNQSPDNGVSDQNPNSYDENSVNQHMTNTQISELLEKNPSSDNPQTPQDNVMADQLDQENIAKRKWKTAVFCMMLRFLLDGMEYAIVLPTLYGFLGKMNANIDYIGIIVAAYALGGFISGPIFGQVSDRFGIGKLVICFGCCLSVVGNLIYFFATTKHHLSIARFFCGLSSGVEPVILGEIGKNEKVKPEKRASLFSMLFTIRQAGILLGPAVVIVLADVSIPIGSSFVIDKSNIGGIFSAICFTICLVCFILFFDLSASTPPDDDLDVDIDAIHEREAQEARRMSASSISDSGCDSDCEEENMPLSARIPLPDVLIEKHIQMAEGVVSFGKRATDSFTEEVKRTHSRTLSSAQLTHVESGTNLKGYASENSLNVINAENGQGTPLLHNRRTSIINDDLAMSRKGTFSNALETSKNITQNSKNVLQNAVNRLGSQLTLVELGSHIGTHITNDYTKYAQKIRQNDHKTGQFSELLCEPVLIGLFGTYAIYVQQSTVETVMTPTTDMILGWKERENAYMLLAVGLECVIGFLSIGPVSRKIGDRGVLLLGTGMISLITFSICLYAPYAAKEVWWLMPVFISSVAAFVFFMPYLVTGAAAVLSRSVPPHRQATVQGIRTSCERCGQILGPLLAAHALNWNLIWVFLPPGLHIILLFVMCVMSKDSLGEESLASFAAGDHIIRKRQQDALKRQYKLREAHKAKNK